MEGSDPASKTLRCVAHRHACEMPAAGVEFGLGCRQLSDLNLAGDAGPLSGRPVFAAALL